MTYEYECETCGMINLRQCSISEHEEGDWDQSCENCGSEELRRVYYGKLVLWSSFGLSGTRYSDSRVEAGLEREKARYGKHLNDEEAQRILEHRGLDFESDPREVHK